MANGKPLTGFKPAIERLLKVTGLNQAELARTLGIHGDQISRILDKPGQIRPQAAQDLAKQIKLMEELYKLAPLVDDHQQRYDEAVKAYVSSQQEKRRSWRAFLWLATTTAKLWANHVKGFTDIARGEVDFEKLLAEPLSARERALMLAARSLYANHGDVDLSDLASLDVNLWGVVVKAVEFYRGAK